MKKVFLSGALLFAFVSHAQDVINQAYTVIKPTEPFSFQSIANNSKILAMASSDGINIIYDKMWNELEKHDAGQEKIYTGSHRASRSAEYDSSNHEYVTTEWRTDDWDYYTSKYGYNLSVFNYYSDFIQGTSKKLYLLRSVSESFLNSHSVSKFSESYTGIAGLTSYVSNSYTSLITRFELVDWDGNVLTTIEPPYYISSGYCQSIEVEDKTYLIISAYAIYPKNVVKDSSLYSSTEYDLTSKQVDPDHYHYYIYEYDKQSGAVKPVRSEVVKANRTLVGIYDIKGNRLEKEQSGINILLYSDGTSSKIIRP